MNTMLIRNLRLMLGAVLTTIVFLSIVTSPALAQAQGGSGTNSDEWKFIVAPYLVLPYMNGTTAIRGHEIEVDLSPSEIFSNLQFGIMGYFEARKAKWGVGVDSIYMALGTTLDQPSANVDFNQGAYTFMGLRKLNEKVDLVFGMRWNVLSGKLDFKEAPLQGVFEGTKQWVDPIVGLKLKQKLGNRFSFSLEGDIGGFGAGSDFAWQLFPSFGVNLGKSTTLGIGYRVLSMDYETGSDEELFKYDVITSGIAIGAAFAF